MAKINVWTCKLVQRYFKGKRLSAPSVPDGLKTLFSRFAENVEQNSTFLITDSMANPLGIWLSRQKALGVYDHDHEHVVVDVDVDVDVIVAVDGFQLGEVLPLQTFDLRPATCDRWTSD